MINGKKVYGVIMIREGSERIKDKCMQEIAGKPLTLWAIQKLLNSNYVDDIYVSTSSERYKDIITGWNNAKIIDRPSKLSLPDVINIDVLKHAINVIPDLEDDDYIVNCSVCEPFTTVDQIVQVIEKTIDYDSCFVTKFNSGKMPDGSVIGTQATAAIRKYNVRTIKSSTHKWGMGIRHIDLDLIPEWHIDINEPYDLIMARALAENGYSLGI